MSLTDDLKKRFASAEAHLIQVDGLPDIYSKSLTLGQIRDIDIETETFTRIARHFQVRAKDENGKPLIAPAEFEDFLRYADADLITTAVSKMQEYDKDFEDAEKKS